MKKNKNMLLGALAGASLLASGSAQAGVGADLVTATGDISTELGLVIPAAVAVVGIVIGAVFVLRAAKRIIS
ncbi:MAG: hypothetical protein QM496_05705 [Verrucomicrobiota bacterium]